LRKLSPLKVKRKQSHVCAWLVNAIQARQYLLKRLKAQQYNEAKKNTGEIRLISTLGLLVSETKNVHLIESIANATRSSMSSAIYKTALSEAT